LIVDELTYVQLLIYIAFQAGLTFMQEIGERFEFSYSAVGQRDKIIKEMLNRDKGIERKYQQI